MPKLSFKSLTACWSGATPAAGKSHAGTMPAAAIGSSPRRFSLTDFSSSSKSPLSPPDLSLSLLGSDLHVFSLEDLMTITRGFSACNFVGEGGFGPVYKGSVDGKLCPRLSQQTVAVKLLDLDGAQGHREWLAEVIFLGQLKHPHLVKLIGYCYEEEHRLLVYEYMPKGSLENHLFRKVIVAPLPWLTRLKIAVGAARGLAFLHDADNAVIYRDFKSSNILLDTEYDAKLSDFGLAKDGPMGEDTHVTTRVMGTHGYAAPEYIMTGHLTTKSDVYSFGVVLLELLSGRRSVDKRRPRREQNLVEWAKPYLCNPHRLDRIVDPILEGNYSTKGVQKAAGLACQCLSHNPKARPNMRTVVETLEAILDLIDNVAGPFVYIAVGEKKTEIAEEKSERKDESIERKEKRGRKEGGKRHLSPHRHKIKFSPLVVHSDTSLYKIYKKNVERRLTPPEK